MLPLFYQEVLGYTAYSAGWVVGPRGFGSFIGSPVVGFLGSRVDPRKLLCGGFLGFSVCSYIFGSVNLGIGPWSLLAPIIFTGFTLSFVFVPLATMTVSTIPNEKMGNATGLFNMLRNIGGSIGISIATTSLVRRAAAHQTYLVAHLSSTSAELQQRAGMLSGYLGRQMGPPGARPGAFGMLYGLVEQQASLLAYVDIFRWTAVLAFFCAIATWLFKKQPRHAAPPPGAH
jgi:MFS transporter, DHA2 family, multidrug resistance protein